MTDEPFKLRRHQRSFLEDIQKLGRGLRTPGVEQPGTPLGWEGYDRKTDGADHSADHALQRRLYEVQVGTSEPIPDWFDSFLRNELLPVMQTLARRAATYVPECRMRFNGTAQEPDLRLRCSHDDKVVFETRADAKRSADHATARGTRMKAYCGPQCGHWHTSRVRNKS